MAFYFDRSNQLFQFVCETTIIHLIVIIYYALRIISLEFNAAADNSDSETNLHKLCTRNNVMVVQTYRRPKNRLEYDENDFSYNTFTVGLPSKGQKCCRRLLFFQALSAQSKGKSTPSRDAPMRAVIIILWYQLGVCYCFVDNNRTYCTRPIKPIVSIAFRVFNPRPL